MRITVIGLVVACSSLVCSITCPEEIPYVDGIPSSLQPHRLVGSYSASLIHHPRSDICTYELKDWYERKVVAWMELTWSPEEDYMPHIKYLEAALSSDRGRTDKRFYGSSFRKDYAQGMPLQIFYRPVPGVELSQTSGWATYVSSTGNPTRATGKDAKDCQSFIEQSLAAIVIAYGMNIDVDKKANFILSLNNALFDKSWSPTVKPSGKFQDALTGRTDVRFVTWTGATDRDPQDDPMGDELDREAKGAALLKENAEDIRRICRI